VLAGEAGGDGGSATAETPAGEGEPAQAPAVAASPELAPIPAPADTPATSLAAASEPAGGIGSGLVMAGLGAALAGAVMLVVRRLRRPIGR
jgi:hypothetical protein